MTRKDFLNLNWDDSHVGYDILVGPFRRIAYMTLSKKHPNCLCLVADNKDFPLCDSGCEISNNLCPADILKYLNKHESIDKILAVVDDEIYDLDTEMFINGIDSEILFCLVRTQNISIPKEDMKFINNLLSMPGEDIYQKYGYKRDETITHTAKFPDGVEADVKLVICEEDTPYTEGVLFQNGFEVAHTEPDDTYDGVWEFIYQGSKYIVNVICTDDEKPLDLQKPEQQLFENDSLPYFNDKPIKHGTAVMVQRRSLSLLDKVREMMELEAVAFEEYIPEIENLINELSEEDYSSKSKDWL